MDSRNYQRHVNQIHFWGFQVSPSWTYEAIGKPSYHLSLGFRGWSLEVELIMFALRVSQIGEMHKAAMLAFHQRILEFLVTSIPDLITGLSAEVLLKRIAVADKRSEIYGIRTERGVAQFASCSFIISPQFDEIPEVQNWLSAPIGDADARIEWFLSSIAEHKKQHK